MDEAVFIQSVRGGGEFDHPLNFKSLGCPTLADCQAGSVILLVEEKT